MASAMETYRFNGIKKRISADVYSIVSINSTKQSKKYYRFYYAEEPRERYDMLRVRETGNSASSSRYDTNVGSARILK